MKWKLTAMATALAFVMTSGVANAAGVLNLFNWGNYTNPELVEKFEKETGIKIIITDYDDNDSALAKIKAGGHGFDLVVPSSNYVPIWIQEGLLLEDVPIRCRTSKTWRRAGKTSIGIRAATTPYHGSGAASA